MPQEVIADVLEKTTAHGGRMVWNHDHDLSKVRVLDLDDMKRIEKQLATKADHERLGELGDEIRGTLKTKADKASVTELVEKLADHSELEKAFKKIADDHLKRVDEHCGKWGKLDCSIKKASAEASAAREEAAKRADAATDAAAKAEAAMTAAEGARGKVDELAAGINAKHGEVSAYAQKAGEAAKSAQAAVVAAEEAAGRIKAEIEPWQRQAQGNLETMKNAADQAQRDAQQANAEASQASAGLAEMQKELDRLQATVQTKAEASKASAALDAVRAELKTLQAAALPKAGASQPSAELAAMRSELEKLRAAVQTKADAGQPFAALAAMRTELDELKSAVPRPGGGAAPTVSPCSDELSRRLPPADAGFWGRLRWLFSGSSTMGE